MHDYLFNKISILLKPIRQRFWILLLSFNGILRVLDPHYHKTYVSDLVDTGRRWLELAIKKKVKKEMKEFNKEMEKEIRGWNSKAPKKLNYKTQDKT